MISCDSRRLLQSFVRTLDHREILALLADWELWARDDQLPPRTPWLTWLVLGGRGAGKTRTGAEWVRAQATGPSPVSPIALVGETFADVRDVMVEGISGLRAVHPAAQRPVYEASRRRVVWPNGAVAQMFSAEDPESLRGPQFAAAWCDELAKWKKADATFDMLQFGLRLGARPRQVITTTPRPIPLLRRLMQDTETAISHATTRANAAHLAPEFLSKIVGRYQGTRLGRQELDGEMIEDRPDALFPRALIERARLGHTPELRRVVVAVDPPAGTTGDACGLVVAGKTSDGMIVVVEDASVSGLSPAGWAQKAIALYHRHRADALVAESNQGGEMVRQVLAQVDPRVPVRLVRASRGKWLRAEPVASLMEQGRVRLWGAFPQLEDEMADFGLDGLSGGRSPDRLDAFVWAVSELMRGSEARIRVL